MFEHDAKTIWLGLSPMMLILGVYCHVVSIAAPHWLANPGAHMGLWNYCSREGDCVGIGDKLKDVDHSWFRSVQGLEIAATVFVLAGVVTGLMKANLGHSLWLTACGVSSIVAGVMGVAGAVVFSKNYETIEDQILSWAFVFNAVGSGLTFLAGPLLILDSLLHRSR